MPTYTPLQSIELTSTSTSVVFSNIPQTYEDLIIIVNGTTNTGSYFTLRFNGDTTSTYSNTEMDGSSSGASSNRNINNNYMYNGSIITTQTNVINHINNYSNSTTNKTVLTRSNYATTGVKASIGLWRNTSAITSIECGTGGSNTFQAGTTFDLYGISPVAADTAQAFGGTEVYYDSTYVYHVFKDSGTFTPYRALTADVLVIAGGGAGGYDTAGGGGAGGVLLHSSQSLTTTNYTVTVGAGASGRNTAGNGSNGSNSQFASLTASVGGGGGSFYDTAGSSGGSGGGGGGNSVNAGGAATSGQGFAGGAGASGVNGGGGGGAGEAGNTDGQAYGGDGTNTYSSWALATATGRDNGYYAGGGSGFTFSVAEGGLGGGGTKAAIENGVTNTGSGGAAYGGATSFSGSGGSGIVIVRYAR
jgi:hypothetical protein